MTFRIEPATAERWEDVATVFGPRDGYGGCWCMWWRLKGREVDAGSGDGNRQRLQDLVVAGHEPGLLAYDADRPVGWVAVAPLPEFGRLLRSPRYRPADATTVESVWSLNCFVIPKGERRRGIARALLDAAIDHAASRGATHLEAYPVDLSGGRVADADLYKGALDWFLDAGFVEVERRRPTAPIVRRRL